MSDPGQDSPYLAGRREWMERYGSYISRAYQWRVIVIILAILLAISVSSNVYLIQQTGIRPYVVEVDRFGITSTRGFADTATSADPRVVRATLGTLIRECRSVYVDLSAQRKAIDQCYAFINSRSPAYQAMREYHAANNPMELAQTATVDIQINSVLAITEHSWRVEWTEQRRGRDGSAFEPVQMIANIAVVISPPTDFSKALLNPLGIFTQTFSWSKRI